MSFTVCNKDHVEMLRKSAATVGFLTDIIVNEEKPNDILSGKHRAEAVENWPKRPKKIDSPLHRELIIIHGNVQQQAPEEVTRQRLLRIANILWTTGGMVNGRMIKPVPKEDVCDRMTDPNDPLVPFTPQWVRKLLPDEYKHHEMKRKKIGKPVSQIKPISASATKKALEPLQSSTNENPNENPFPFPDCKCKDCSNKTLCY